MSPEFDALMNPDTLDWIDSNGGPLLLLSKDLLPDWEGINPPSSNRHIQANFRWLGSDAPATDYDRACDVQDYLGKIDVGSGWALVLGGEPMSTCWLPNRTGEAGIVLRWQYGEDEDSVLSSLPNMPEDIWQTLPFSFDVGRQPLYLFDAAYPGITIHRFLEIALPEGNYSLAKALFKPDNYTSLVLHRVVPYELVASESQW